MLIFRAIVADAEAGDDIDACVKHAVALANKHDCVVKFTFNGIDLAVTKSMDIDTVIECYKLLL